MKFQGKFLKEYQRRRISKSKQQLPCQQKSPESQSQTPNSFQNQQLSINKLVKSKVTFKKVQNEPQVKEKKKILTEPTKSVNNFQQNFVSINQDDNSEGFFTAELVNKLIMLVFIMLVMVFLGVVTPNTVLANRKPEQRSLKTHKKIVQPDQTTFSISSPKNFSQGYEEKATMVKSDRLRKQSTGSFIRSKAEINLSSESKSLILFRPMMLNPSASENDNSLEDKQVFRKSIDSMISEYLQSIHNSFFQNNSIQPPISSTQQSQNSQRIIRSIKLSQVTHNVDFSGRIIIDQQNLLPQEQNTLQSIIDKHNRLTEILSEQEQFYEDKYSIMSYQKNEIHFCIFVNFNLNEKEFLANKFYLRVLDSIFMQDYENYRVVILVGQVSDGNDQNERMGSKRNVDLLVERIDDYMQINDIPVDKYTILQQGSGQTTEQLLESRYLSNLKKIIKDHLQQGEKLIILNQNQAFIGRQVLSLYSAVYQSEKVSAIYTSSLRISKDDNIEVYQGEKTIQKLQSQPSSRSEEMKETCKIMPQSFQVQFLAIVKKKQHAKNQNNFDVKLCLNNQAVPQSVYFLPEITFQERIL